jgi:hypothetical protein
MADRGTTSVCLGIIENAARQAAAHRRRECARPGAIGARFGPIGILTGK